MREGRQFLVSIIDVFKPNLETFVNFPGAYAGSRKFIETHETHEKLLINSNANELQAEIEPNSGTLPQR